MDSYTRFSHGLAVTSVIARQAIDLFETIWVSQYWYPKATLADESFAAFEFKEHVTKMSVKFMLHIFTTTKNFCELKHRILHDIFN